MRVLCSKRPASSCKLWQIAEYPRGAVRALSMPIQTLTVTADSGPELSAWPPRPD